MATNLERFFTVRYRTLIRMKQQGKTLVCPLDIFHGRTSGNSQNVIVCFGLENSGNFLMW